jgi:hypothetical protein
MPTSKSSGSSSMSSASSSTSRSSVSGSKRSVVKERGRRLHGPIISTVSKRKKTGSEHIQVPGMQRFGEWVMCVLVIDGY